MEKDWEFHHIAVIVRDMEKAAEYFETIGLMPVDLKLLGMHLEGFELMAGSQIYKDYKLFGKTPDTPVKQKVRFFERGGLLIEVIQPVEGYSQNTEFLEKHGEGIDHICYFVEDLEKERAKFIKRGMSIIVSATGTSSFIYIDTREVGNIMLELVQKSTQEKTTGQDLGKYRI
ncbi:MAG: VOC family protein [Chloroflexi bacterium]|nr:VOC family protein [Chloroflexota bacterium]